MSSKENKRKIDKKYSSTWFDEIEVGKTASKVVFDYNQTVPIKNEFLFISKNVVHKETKKEQSEVQETYRQCKKLKTSLETLKDEHSREKLVADRTIKCLGREVMEQFKTLERLKGDNGNGTDGTDNDIDNRKTTNNGPNTSLRRKYKNAYCIFEKCK